MQISYFTPWTDPAAGTSRDPDSAPLLFKPIKVNGLTMHNRIMVRHPGLPVVRQLVTASNAGLAHVPVSVSNATCNKLGISSYPFSRYSAQDGHMTMSHWTHLGGIIQRGPGMTMIEATAVVPEGRITP